MLLEAVVNKAIEEEVRMHLFYQEIYWIARTFIKEKLFCQAQPSKSADSF